MYTDVSRRGAGYVIMQIQNGEERLIQYDSFLFSKSERNYDTYKRELLAIVKFATKFRHFFDALAISTLQTDQKPLLGFLNIDYKDIFTRQAIKLRNLNVQIKQIKGRRNLADGLLRVIFNEDCTETPLVRELSEQVKKHDGNKEQFQKTGKGGYQDTLRKLYDKELRTL